MRAERTFWEKVTLAHVYCLEGKLRGATGFARHWHDLIRLDDAGFAAAAMADHGLAKAVADHKSKFFPPKDAHDAPVDYYYAAVGGHLTLVPQEEAFDLLKADYESSAISLRRLSRRPRVALLGHGWRSPLDSERLCLRVRRGLVVCATPQRTA